MKIVAISDAFKMWSTISTILPSYFKIWKFWIRYSGENTFGGLEGLEELDDEDWEAMLSDFDGWNKKL